MNWPAFFLAIFALLALPVKGGFAHDLTFVNVAVPASLTPTTTSGIIYLDIENHGTAEDSLLSVSSPVARSAMMHESYKDGDTAKMRMLQNIVIPAGGRVALQQGGKHVMLTGLKSPLKKGDNITISLTFEKAGQVPLQVTVGEPVTGLVTSK